MAPASILDGLLNPLIEFLLCLAAWFLGALEWLLITILNLFITVIMAIISPVLALLGLVGLEHITLPPFLALVNYILPLAYAITLAGVLLTVELVWWAVHIALRWAKAARA